MATVNKGLFTPTLNQGKDALATVYDVLISAACALEGVSALLDTLAEESAAISGISYAADEVVSLHRQLLNQASMVVMDLQRAGSAPAQEAACAPSHPQRTNQ